MWSILVANIQAAHDRDPSVYAFTDYLTYEDYLNPTQDEMKAYKVTCVCVCVCVCVLFFLPKPCVAQPK